MEAAPYKIATEWPLASHLTNLLSKRNKTYWISEDKFINKLLIWFPTQGHISVDWLLHTHMQIHTEHNDTMKTNDTVLRKIYLSLYLKGWCVRGSWRPNRTAIYWPPLLWPSALCLSRSPGLFNRRPGGPAFCLVLAFSTTSCHQWVWSPN